jgi:hypothetical protein
MPNAATESANKGFDSSGAFSAVYKVNSAIVSSKNKLFK